MKAILALDQGTTSSRAIVFDSSGKVVAVAQREFPQIYPHPGWVEHDPREIASSQLEVAAAVSKKFDIAAIGITNQRETTILWDRMTGEPIANAIVWQDRRTAAMCDELREYEPLFRERTGLVLDPYFSGTKIRWLLDHTSADPERWTDNEELFASRGVDLSARGSLADCLGADVERRRATGVSTPRATTCPRQSRRTRATILTALTTTTCVRLGGR